MTHTVQAADDQFTQERRQTPQPHLRNAQIRARLFDEKFHVPILTGLHVVAESKRGLVHGWKKMGGRKGVFQGFNFNLFAFFRFCLPTSGLLEVDKREWRKKRRWGRKEGGRGLAEGAGGRRNLWGEVTGAQTSVEIFWKKMFPSTLSFKQRRGRVDKAKAHISQARKSISTFKQGLWPGKASSSHVCVCVCECVICGSLRRNAWNDAKLTWTERERERGSQK